MVWERKIKVDELVIMALVAYGALAAHQLAAITPKQFDVPTSSYSHNLQHSPTSDAINTSSGTISGSVSPSASPSASPGEYL